MIADRLQGVRVAFLAGQFREALETLAALPIEIRASADALLFRSMALWRTGEYVETAALAREAGRGFRAVGDSDGTMRSENVAAAADFALGHLSDARVGFARALSLADMLGDDLPSDELNHAPRSGMNFGYPWCHQGDTLDPEFGKDKSCADYTPPELMLGAHVAALGLTFYTGSMFPSSYHNQLFIAQHGSWNRSEKVGCNIILVRFDEEGNVLGQDLFASGWLQGDDCWGRPNDVLQMPDGSLLVADDKADSIYRISYQGKR